MKSSTNQSSSPTTGSSAPNVPKVKVHEGQWKLIRANLVPNEESAEKKCTPCGVTTKQEIHEINVANQELMQLLETRVYVCTVCGNLTTRTA